MFIPNDRSGAKALASSLRCAIRSSTRTFEEARRYDEGALLENGDIVAAGSGLRRFERGR